MTIGGEAAVAPRSGRRRRIGIAVAVGIVVAIVVFLLFSLDHLLVDRLWFESVGQLSVWDVSTFSRLLLWIPVSLVIFGLLMASIVIAIRIVRRSPVRARGMGAGSPRRPAGPLRLAAHARRRRPRPAHADRRTDLPPHGSSRLALPGAGRGPRRARHRVRVQRPVADRPSLDPPGLVGPGRCSRRPGRDTHASGRRPHLRPATDLLLLRPALRSIGRRPRGLDPGCAHRADRDRLPPLPARGARVPVGAGLGVAPRRPRGPADRDRRDRVPAGQVLARDEPAGLPVSGGCRCDGRSRPDPGCGPHVGADDHRGDRRPRRHRRPSRAVGARGLRRLGRPGGRCHRARHRQPGALREPQPARPAAPLHRERHRRHPHGLRPRRLDDALLPGDHVPAASRHRERGGDLRERAPLGRSPAASDPGPAPDRPPVLRLHRRRHRPLSARWAAARHAALRAGDGARQEPGGRELAELALRVHARLRARDGARVGCGLRWPARSHHPRSSRHVRGGRADGQRAEDLLRGAPGRVDRSPARRLPSSTTRSTWARMPRPAGPPGRAST